MKKEQFERCLPKLLQEYERSKGKHADFDTVDRAWRAIQREYCEVMNEMLRDTIKEEALAMEMLHLSNVALQGYMFLTEDEKENRTMNKEWWDGVIEACQALRDGKEAQGKTVENDWYRKSLDDVGGVKERLVFYTESQYRAKTEPKLRPLTPQEWFEALLVGKKLIDGISFSLTGGDTNRALLIDIEELDRHYYYTPEQMLSCHRMFSDGSPCGVEVEE